MAKTTRYSVRGEEKKTVAQTQEPEGKKPYYCAGCGKITPPEVIICEKCAEYLGKEMHQLNKTSIPKY